MSLSSFKKTSVIRYGSKRSGKPPGGIWLPQGPFGFGANNKILKEAFQSYGAVGFSLEGAHRNVGYIGKDCRMSRNGTPFRGVNAVGWGGTYGNYPATQPVFNVGRVITQGQQWEYVKPSVLSTKGMLEKKYRWINNGQFPNNWVQPNYASTNQSATKSQGMYIHDKTTSNMTVSDVNAAAKYVGNIKCSQPNLYGNSTAQFRYDDLARNAPYTKQLHNIQPSSIHTLRIQRRCTLPIGPQKPFPWATNGNACNSTNLVFLSPPDWYSKITEAQQAFELTDNVEGVSAATIANVGPVLQYATSKEIGDGV